MISQDRNASRVASMQANQGRDRPCQAKSHVQSARESHDLNMGFFLLQTASRNEFLCKSSSIDLNAWCYLLIGITENVGHKLF